MIPANVTSELAALQAQVSSAAPLASASAPTISAIQLNAEQLVSDIATALANAAGQLDTFMPPPAPTDPAGIVAGVLAIAESATDQFMLADMGGFVGRAAANLDTL
jgi:hypothetical protein